MSWEPRPTPAVYPETEVFWAAATEGTFLLRSCEECNRTIFYPRNICPYCFSDDLDWLESDGTGKVYTYTVSQQVGQWDEEALPVIQAYVELAEGIRVPTVLEETDPEEVYVGMPVVATFVPTADDQVAIPVFVPEDSE